MIGFSDAVARHLTPRVCGTLVTSPISQGTFHPLTPPPHHQQDSHRQQQAMAANINRKKARPGNRHSERKAKVLTEKLDTMAQRSSAHQRMSKHISSLLFLMTFTDNASEFSAYSLLTPSATSKSERNEEESLSEEQAPVEDQTEIDEIPELVPVSS